MIHGSSTLYLWIKAFVFGISGYFVLCFLVFVLFCFVDIVVIHLVNRTMLFVLNNVKRKGQRDYSI